jgi:hypothetical protein
MLNKRQNYYHSPSRFSLSVYLALSTIAFTMDGATCQAFSNEKISKQSNLSSSNSVQSGDLTIAQSIIPPVQSFIPILQASPAFLEIIPGLMPMPVVETAPVREVGYSSPEQLDYDNSEPLPGAEPLPIQTIFSLKAVRQSVDIILPSEEEIAALPELSFDKMYPGVAGYADQIINGRRVDFYQFEGTQDQQIVVVLRNSADDRPVGLPLMPYMMVFDPNRQIMAATVVPGSYRIPTDDPLLPIDNQLALRLPQSGRYIVAVFTNPGENGRYGVGWKQDETQFRYDEMLELTAVESAPTEITGKAGQAIQIQVNSYQFDPVVTLEDVNGNIIAKDDDNGGNYNARINVTLPADGVYRAIVSSANRSGQGQYRLRMR